MIAEVIEQCQDDFVVSLAEFVPGDYPAKAMHDMTVNTCLKLSDSIPSKCLKMINLSDRRTSGDHVRIQITLLPHQLQTSRERS